MPRIARVTEVNYPHHVVQRGNNKQMIFFDEDDRRLYIHLLKRYSEDCACSVNAYCLMPNHVHMVLVPLQSYAISKTMQKLSLRYTQCLNKKYKRTGRLWECRFYSSIIQREASLWAVCRYIERNPVRAKIVEMPGQYKWSSAGVLYSMKKYEDFVVSIWCDNHEKEEYMRFLDLPEETDEIEKIRRATLKGIPIGSEYFIKQLTEKLGIIINANPRGRPRREK